MTVLAGTALGGKWAEVYFSALRADAIKTSGAVVGAALSLAGILTAVTLIKMYYDMASDEKNGGFGGISLWEVLRPVVLMIVIASSSFIIGAIDGITNSLSGALVSNINTSQVYSREAVEKKMEELRANQRDGFETNAEAAAKRAERNLGYTREQLNTNIKAFQLKVGIDANKVKDVPITVQSDEVRTVSTDEGDIEVYKTYTYNTVRLRETTVQRKIKKVYSDGDEAAAQWDMYKEYLKELNDLDEETKRQRDLARRENRLINDLSTDSMGVVEEVIVILFNIVFNLTMIFADVLLCLLAIFFPVVVAFSIIPSWKGSLMNWIGKYIEVSMWKPIAAGICWVVGTAQLATKAGALEAVQNAQMIVGGEKYGSWMGCLTATVIVLYAGIKCFWKVPSIATTIFGLGGGALSDFGSMAGAAAMAGAQALGKGAKAAASPVTSMAGGAVAGKMAGVGAGTGAMTGLGNLVGKMTGMGHYSGKGFSGAMNQIFNGGNEISGTDNSKKDGGSTSSASHKTGGGGGSSTSTGSAVGGSADASGMEKMFGPSNPSIPEANEEEGSFVD